MPDIGLEGWEIMSAKRRFRLLILALQDDLWPQISQHKRGSALVDPSAEMDSFPADGN